MFLKPPIPGGFLDSWDYLTLNGLREGMSWEFSPFYWIK